MLGDTAGPQGRYGGLTSTGFAEVAIGDLRLDEAVRPPVDLLRRAGADSAAHPLAFVLTRLRSAATDVERLDEERSLVRLLDLPTARGLRPRRHGPAVAPGRRRTSLDAVLGRPGSVPVLTATSSSRLAGTAARASAAVDGDPATAWVAAYGDQVGQWIDVVAEAAPQPIDRLDLDARRRRTSLRARPGSRLEADGQRRGLARGPRRRRRRSARRHHDGLGRRSPHPSRPPTCASWWRTCGASRRRTGAPGSIRTMPVGVAELGIPGLTRPRPDGPLRLRLPNRPPHAGRRPRRPSRSAARSRTPSPARRWPCGRATARRSPSPRARTSCAPLAGATTGLDVDRVVLRSDADGAAATATGPLADRRCRRTDDRGARPGHGLCVAAGCPPPSRVCPSGSSSARAGTTAGRPPSRARRSARPSSSTGSPTAGS